MDERCTGSGDDVILGGNGDDDGVVLSDDPARLIWTLKRFCGETAQIRDTLKKR
jgi:hypothetical protein